jgi:hypothetical protein
MNRVRASISATLSEIERNPYRGLIEQDEKNEALAIIGRIEQALNQRGIEGDRKWSARG